MAIDPSIALQIRPPAIEDPLTLQAKGLQLRDLMGQQQVRQMALEDAQRARREEMTLADLYRSTGGDAAKLRAGLAAGGLGARIPAFDKQQAELTKTQGESELKRLEALKQKTDLTAAGLSSLLMRPNVTQDDVIRMMVDFVRKGIWTTEEGQAAVGTLPGPEALRGFLLQKGSEAMEASKRIDLALPKTGTIDAGNRVIPTQTDQLTGEVTQGQPIVKAPEGYTVGPNGSLTVDPGFLKAKQSIAAAGRPVTNLNVNTAKDLTSTMAEGLGKQLDASLASANSGVNTIGTADQIRRLAGAGKLITGTAADARTWLARLGDTLGVGGADTKEKLANTAALVQNLAKVELEAASAMKGQGAVTESERAILRRAASGDQNMTPAELMTLANGLDKAARARIKAHEQQVKRMGTLPGAGPLMPFYQVPEPPAGGTDPRVPGAPAVPSGPSVIRFDAQGNMIQGQ